MRCSIASLGLRSWGRAIHALVAIGDNDIHFEFTGEALTLTTFDASLSVCATATFERDFFMSYEIPEDRKLACRVPSKCILKPFRSLRFLTKPVSICEIGIPDSENGDKLEINIKCSSGTSIRYFILLTTNTESIQVDYDMTLLKNCIQADSKLIVSSLGNFHSKGVADLTINVTENKILLKNSTTDLSKKDSSVHTEVTLNKVEFNEFTIDFESELTFPMREFKCFANFAETLRLPLCINFHGTNEPVIVTIMGDENYRATLTLATKLMDNDNPSNTSQSSSTVSRRSSQSSTIASISSVPSEPQAPPTRLTKLPNRKLEAELLIPVSLPRAPEPMQQNDDQDQDFSEYFNDLPLNPTTPALAPLKPLSAGNTPYIHTIPNSEPGSAPNTNNKNLISDLLSRGRPPYKRMKALFPNLGSAFEAAIDIPGHDVILLRNSDDEYDYDDE